MDFAVGAKAMNRLPVWREEPLCQGGKALERRLGKHVMDGEPKPAVDPVHQPRIGANQAVELVSPRPVELGRLGVIAPEHARVDLVGKVEHAPGQPKDGGSTAQ